MTDKKLRAGIIGLGIGKSHAKGYLNSPDAELVALCDMRESLLDQFGSEWNVAGRFTDYQKMFAEANLDIVSVCLPNALHADVSIAGLEAGAHVVCEKPMALSVVECQKMIAAAERTQRRLMVSYNWRYRPDSQWMHNMVHSGKLGQIYHANVSWRRETGIPGWGLFHGKAASGGGALIDLGVHMIDLGLWMMGFPSVETVSADTRSLFGPRGLKTWGRTPGQKIEGGFDVDDGAVGFARLSNGANMFIQITWAEHTEPQDDDFRVELQGTEGTAIMHVRNYKHEDTLRYYTEIEGEPVTVIPTPRAAASYHHESLIKDIIDALVHDKPAPTTGEQGLIAVQVLEAMYDSSQTRREVVLGV